uniref:V-type proton ATPase subunit S1/VOA1 transmembrane domain-containing protein n=1 Tax=Acrobeloides nanus TaxID=290746 RepID=A0A914DA25_9BILA
MKLLFLYLSVLTFNELLCDTAVNKNEEALSRQKRLTVDGVETSNNERNAYQGSTRQFPIRIPYESSTDTDDIGQHANWGTCLMYLEGVTIVVIDHTKDKNGQKAVFAKINGTQGWNTWTFDETKTLDCTIKNATQNNTIWFHVQINISPEHPVIAMDGGYEVTGTLGFILTFKVPSLDNWYLDSVQLVDINIKKGSFIEQGITIDDFNQNDTTTTAYDTHYANIRGFYGYSFGCSSTPAIFFRTKEKVAVGIQLNNFQVEAYNIYANKDKAKGKVGIGFKSTVNDCVPTFSVGSWMSIIASLVLAAVFIFGFLMLNSIQTMDRFDDPKAKQIIINAKE